MIKPQWLELPMSRTNFLGPVGIQALKFDCTQANKCVCFRFQPKKIRRVGRIFFFFFFFFFTIFLLSTWAVQANLTNFLYIYGV